MLARVLDDALAARLKERAKNHRPLQGEVKAILKKWRKRWGERTFSDRAELIRELRER